MNSPQINRSMVMISPSVPNKNPSDAGTRLIGDLVAMLMRADQEVTVLSAEGEAAVLSFQAGTLTNTRLGRRREPGKISAGLAKVDRMIGLSSDRIGVPPSFVFDKRNIGLLKRARLIDLQWQEQGGLIRRIRRINPEARITVTLHDVQSQRYQRSAKEGRNVATKAYWSIARFFAKIQERRILKYADDVIVLSDKDRALLPAGSARVHVLSPAFSRGLERVRNEESGVHRLLMVGLMSRWENEQGLRWFLEHVLPVIRQRYPDTVLEVAGRGASNDLRELVDTVPDVRLLGFVEDLDELYSTADAVVVPLFLGGGLKFKTVEALCAGVPVVSTSVGAEGVGPKVWFAGVCDSPDEFARTTIGVFDNQGYFEERAEQSRRLASLEYGQDRFTTQISGIYGTSDAVDSGDCGDVTEHNQPFEVSVVIPAFNCVGTIDKQLHALERQTFPHPFEVIVADNGSDDDLERHLGKWRGRLNTVYVDAAQIAGAPHARNAGANAAMGNKLLFCDADDRANPDWIRNLADALDTYDVVGGATHLVDSHGLPWDSVQPSLADALPSIYGYLPYALAGNMGVRKEVFEGIGGYDTSYIGHEETDLSWRIQNAGFSLGFVPDAVIEYVQRATNKSAFRQGLNFGKSSIHLWARFESDLAPSAVSFSGALRALGKFLVSFPKQLKTNRSMWAYRELGWRVGKVMGHLAYRKLGEPPTQRLSIFAKSLSH